MGAASEEVVNGLKNDIKQKEDEVDKLKEDIEAFDIERSGFKKQISEKDEEIERMVTKLKKLEVENGASARKMMREAEEKYEQLVKEHDKVMHSNERFKIMYKITKAMLLLLCRHSADLACDNMDSFERIDKMNREFQAKINVLNAKIKDRDKEIDQLAQEKKD